MTEHLLDVRDLRVSLNINACKLPVLRSVSFYVDKGETLAIVGESGCGKSVTVQTIMRILSCPPMWIDGGEIIYSGKRLLQMTDKEMEKYRGCELALISQESMSSLDPTMQIGKQVCEGIIHHKGVSKDRAKAITLDLFSQVRLPNPSEIYNRYPHTLSGGQRQRVMIAMAIICSPKVLFADEPTTALDVTLQAHILEVLNNIKEAHETTIVVITHDLRVVATTADRVAVMYSGEIIETGSTEQVLSTPAHPYTWGLLCSLPTIRKGKADELYTLSGAPPMLGTAYSGCAFAERCDYAMSVCLKLSPPEYSYRGHSSCCWLHDPRASDVQPPNEIPKTELASLAESVGGVILPH